MFFFLNNPIYKKTFEKHLGLRFSTGWIWIVWVNGIFQIGFTQNEEDVIRFARVELLCLLKLIFLAQWRFVIGDFVNLGLCGSSIYSHLSISSRWTLSVIANAKQKEMPYILFVLLFYCDFIQIYYCYYLNTSPIILRCFVAKNGVVLNGKCRLAIKLPH